LGRDGAKKGVGAMRKEHIGSSIDDFLKGEDVFEEAQAQAIKEVVAWRLAKAMEKKSMPRSWTSLISLSPCTE
jgi:hypothetical protein